MSTQSDTTAPLVIIVMGVSGCGKSTVADIIASQIGAHGKDGDQLHPKSNIDKMAAGIPLTDEDRAPWLQSVATYARDHASAHGICVIACSALKQRYRKLLDTAGRVVYIYLYGSRELIASRMQHRSGHFMPETLLDSQFDTLEDPRSEPNVLTISIEHAPAEVAGNAIAALKQNHHLV